MKILRGSPTEETKVRVRIRMLGYLGVAVPVKSSHTHIHIKWCYVSFLLFGAPGALLNIMSIGKKIIRSSVSGVGYLANGHSPFRPLEDFNAALKTRASWSNDTLLESMLFCCFPSS